MPKEIVVWNDRVLVRVDAGSTGPVSTGIIVNDGGSDVEGDAVHFLNNRGVEVTINGETLLVLDQADILISIGK